MLTVEQAYKFQDEYRGSETERAKIADTSMLVFIGGVAVGKNYLMQQTGFNVCGTQTSRGYRPGDDPTKYTYPTTEELLRAIEAGELIQYGAQPPDTIYASGGGDYALGETNAADIWFDAYEPLKNKGFKDVQAVSILAPGAQWRRHLDERFAGRTHTYVVSRLEEAKHSLRWSLAHHLSRSANHLLVINDENQTGTTLKRIRLFAEGARVEPLDDTLVTEVARQMFTTIETYRH